MYSKFTKQNGIPPGYASKLLLIMKLTTIILIGTLMQVSAASFAQRLTLQKNKVSLKEIFNEIKSQTGYNVVWDAEQLKDAKAVSANFKNTELTRVLESIMSGQPLDYTIADNTIVIKRKEVSFLDKASLVIQNSLKNLIQSIDVRGKVIDGETGQGLPGATVKVKGTSNSVTTDAEGNFFLRNVDEKEMIVIAYVGYKRQELAANKNMGTIKLDMESSNLQEVTISTGYEMVSPERATGSYTLIDNKLLNRTVSPDLLSRLKGVTNGLLVDRNTGNTLGISVRGRSTIFSNTAPLIVVDNFPFEGDLNTINPDMIENVTVLKDAAAASIWGVRAGNGVIVITTKKGKLNQKPAISFKSDLTLAGKPDLYYQPQLTSAEFIEVEKFLFDKGLYNSTINNGWETISPVIAILQKMKADPTYVSQGNQAIEAFKALDYRGQQQKYLYRGSSLQHYVFDIAGGGGNQSYYFSGGYDKNLPNAIQLNDDRITLKSSNNYYLLKRKLNLGADINFSRSRSYNGNISRNLGFVPYEQIADVNGNPSEVVFFGGLRSSYTDNAGGGRLKNWKYYPLEELRQEYSTEEAYLRDYRINISSVYEVAPFLKISGQYQYYYANRQAEQLHQENSFFARNLINSYSQISGTNLTRPIPAGAIYIPSYSRRSANYGRLQANFNHVFQTKHDVSALAGYEVRDDESQEGRGINVYGYNVSTETNLPVDYSNNYPLFYSGVRTRIPSGNRQRSTWDKNISYYATATYTFDNRYTVFGSFRKDASNLFGVKANQKGVPLWSTGFTWNVLNEDFMKLDWLNTLKLKTSYGYNGNVNNSVSAYLTTIMNGEFNSYSNSLYYTIVNPPNEFLRWERVKNFNAGLHFSLKSDRLSGSFEYYSKLGTDLIGTSPIAPQTGITEFIGNTANTSTKGIDIQLHSINVNGEFKWMTDLIVNRSNDKIKTYKVAVGSNSTIVSATATSLSPLEGNPIYSIYGFRWAGLDNTGSPQGYLDGVVSKSYAGIRNSTNSDQLFFAGSGTPTIFGSLKNGFSFRNFEFSFNLVFKAGYYFRRQSLDNSSLYSRRIVYTQPDYSKRWQKPGDEMLTNVPALIYPANGPRSDFYNFSEVLIERGDHIRLQDLQLNYTFANSQKKLLPFNSLNIYAYISNTNILWAKSKFVKDPEVRSGLPNPTTFALGFKVNF